MRILFAHTIGKKKFGGGERWVINAACGLKSKGHHVIVAGKKNSVLLNEAKEKGIETAVFNISTDYNIFQAFRLSRFIRSNNIDVVICKGRELVVSGMAVKLSKRAILIRRSGSPPRKKSRKLIWRTKRFVTGVITNTQTIKDIYSDHGLSAPGLVKVIYNGLRIDDAVKPCDFSEKYPGKKIVLCIGRLVGHKGYFDLIDALPVIKATQPDTLFYILGDGRDKHRLIRHAKKTGVAGMIHFAGYLQQPIAHIKGCDLFLHPSHYEGMPNAAMEAMAYGKPVIMTHVNGAGELSDNGKYAILIPPASPGDIAEAVINALSNTAQLTEMAGEGKVFVRKRFDMNTMVDNIEAFLLECLKKSKS